MKTTRRTHKNKFVSRFRCKEGVCLIVFIVFAGGFLLWFLPSAYAVEKQYVEISAVLKSERPFVATARVDGSSVRIPDWHYFANGHMWNLVNKKRTLPASFTPMLVDAPVAHTNGSIQIAASIQTGLLSLVNSAKSDGIRIMLSSAYRSADDQQVVYDGYLRLYGQTYVDSYVAKPGQSEHQTGLAVDIATYSPQCKLSANDCSLDADATAWLKKHAAQHGFIQRYPAGKQSITGVAGEAWHYRYVGTELAELLTSTGMTLDEFVRQIAPGYAR